LNPAGIGNSPTNRILSFPTASGRRFSVTRKPFTIANSASTIGPISCGVEPAAFGCDFGESFGDGRFIEDVGG